MDKEHRVITHHCPLPAHSGHLDFELNFVPFSVFLFLFFVLFCFSLVIYFKIIIHLCN